MKTNLLLTPLFFIPLLACAQEFPNLVENAYKNGADAAKLLAQANDQMSAADTLLNDNKTIISSLDFAISDLQQTNNSLANINANLAQSIQKEQVLQAKYEKDYESAKAISYRLINLFPVGESRIAYGKSLAQKAKQLGNEYPGENYQDRNYIMSAVAEYESACAEIANLRASILSLNLSISISSPRLDGTKSFLNMAQNYTNQVSQLTSQVSQSIGNYQTESKGMNDAWTDVYKKLSDRSVELSARRNEVADTYLNLSLTLLNDMRNSIKYKDYIFKNIEYPSIPNPYSLFDASPYKSKDAFVLREESQSAPRQMLAATQMKARAAGTTNLENISDGISPLESRNNDAAQAAPRNARSEILTLAADLRSLSMELRDARMFILDSAVRAQKLYSEIELQNGRSTNLLNSAIAQFASAQSAFSNSEMLQSRIDVAKIQCRIVVDQINQSLGNVGQTLEKISETNKEMAKNVSDAKTQLEK